MQITSFKDMYIAELQELRSLEEQLAEALLRLAQMASHPSLKQALTRHRDLTPRKRDSTRCCAATTPIRGRTPTRRCRP